MKIEVLAFGIAKDIFGGAAISVDLEGQAVTANLKQKLEEQYPKLKELRSYMIAVNDEYAQADTTFSALDEIAVIPPVSGG